MSKSKQKLLFNSQDAIDWDHEIPRIIRYIQENGIKMVYFDLFCGAGGLSKGVEDSRTIIGKLFAYVALGINHDRLAIASHKINFPDTLHMVEDIREVILEPLARLAREIRIHCPGVKIVMWVSAECTHHSKAKGGDSRDADSRSLPEEIKRYQIAIMPDLIQVENVTEFRSWGPLEQKVSDTKKLQLSEHKHKLLTEYGQLRSKNKNVWINWKNGLTYKKVKKGGVQPWMVPIKARKEQYFKEWVESIKALGYEYDDRDINAADHGARTNRVRYYGQFFKGMPAMWPEPSHAKDPAKYKLRTGKVVEKHLPVRPLIDFTNKGPSLLVPGRIKSNQTIKRVTEGNIRFVAGGKVPYKERMDFYKEWLNGWQGSHPKVGDVNSEGFLLKYNSASPASDNFKHTVSGFDQSSPTLVNRNMIAKIHPEFIPFMVQFNNNCDANSLDEPSRSLTQKDKFAVAFIQQHNNGQPESKVASLDNPSRVVTAMGNQSLVQVESVLPFLSVYHGNGHNCHSVDGPAPAACAADIQAVVNPVPFIFRQYGQGGGHFQKVDQPAGSIIGVPKMNIISPEAWIMDTAYNNIGGSVDEPAKPKQPAAIIPI